jgi:[glutamine synthetase] adenylyltransferase / [glutamine synthetase]-adenylyl-L-tyrosine phosphorylase
VLRDLSGGDRRRVGEELTALGEACLTGRCATSCAGRPGRGLDRSRRPAGQHRDHRHGQARRRELHYVSDLDVLFVHEVVEGADERRGHQARARDRRQRDAVAVGDHRRGHRLRGRRRPAARGPQRAAVALARLLPAYWERWAEPWEHQALLRARHVAGDRDSAAVRASAPASFAYPEDPTSDALPDAADEGAAREGAHPRRVDPERHLKLGPGGLSDVEWTVQLLQQRTARARPGLRTTSTMAALDALQDADLIEHRDAAWLRDGYRFLSELRNRLYLLRHRDVDVLPSSQPELETLARAMGYGRGGWQELEEDRRRHARHVVVCEHEFYGL